MKTEHINDGGPAFPTDNEQQVGHNTWHYQGMTLRDYFAAAALQGLLACPRSSYVGGKKLTAYWQYGIASYRLADALLAERARKEAQP